MNATTIAVDWAKTVFELAITDEQGRLVERKRQSREGFARFFANRPPCRIVMEACATAHHWARTLQAQGHEVKLLPPQHGRPYVRRTTAKLSGRDVRSGRLKALVYARHGRELMG